MESKLSDRRREAKELKLGLKGLASSQRSIGLKTGPSTRSTDPMRKSLERKPLLSLSERRRASKQLKIDDLSSPMPVDRSPIIEDNAESLQTPQLECLNVRPQAMLENRFINFKPNKKVIDQQSTDNSSKNSTPINADQPNAKVNIVFRTLSQMEKNISIKKWSKAKCSESAAGVKKSSINVIH